MATGKTELVKCIANETKLTKVDAKKALKAILTAISSSLQKGEEVKLIGFGTFAVQQSAAREGRNPKTGEKIKIKARKRPVFRAGKELKESLNKA